MKGQLPIDASLEPPIDPATQVSRMPGTDAPCLCREPACEWPWCCPVNQEDIEEAA